ncbi:MATE family efflux transporter [bacterium]
MNNKATLTEGYIGKTLLNLTIPMFFGLLSIILFNLVDTFFLGRLGNNELAAISFTLPVVTIIAGFTLGLGVGASVTISHAIGQGDHHKVQRLTTDSLILSIVLVLFFISIGLLTINPLFTLLGARTDILILIKKYMSVWYFGVPFVVLPMVGNNAIRATGDAKTPAYIMIFGSLVNFILDPLLIFGIGFFPKLGITGAAIATVIARALTFVFSFYILFHRDKMITFKLVKISEIIQSWKQILYIGLPVALTRIIMPLEIGVLTGLIASYGPKSVAAFGVATRIEFFALAVILALASVLAPFIGQNLGAKKIERIFLSIKYSNQFSIIWGFFLFTIFTLLAHPIASIFTNDKLIILQTASYLKIVSIAFGLEGVLIIINASLNTLKKPFLAASLIIIQGFALCIPLAFLGSHFIGLNGIFTGISLAYIVSGILAYLINAKRITFINY